MEHTEERVPKVKVGDAQVLPARGVQIADGKDLSGHEGTQEDVDSSHEAHAEAVILSQSLSDNYPKLDFREWNDKFISH